MEEYIPPGGLPPFDGRPSLVPFFTSGTVSDVFLRGFGRRSSAGVRSISHKPSLTIVSRSGVGLHSVVLTSSGARYRSPPVVVISGGGGGGAQATAFINEYGQVAEVRLTDSGSGYTSTPAVHLVGGLDEDDEDAAEATAYATLAGAGAADVFQNQWTLASGSGNHTLLAK